MASDLIISEKHGALYAPCTTKAFWTSGLDSSTTSTVSGMLTHSPLSPHDDATTPDSTLLITDPITSSTVFFGVEGVATERADTTSLFSGNIHDNPVFRGTYNGEPVAIKFYSDVSLNQFETEASFYQLLGQDANPTDSKNFAEYRASGEVVLCSRGVVDGTVPILTMEAGRQLGLVWDVLDMGERGDAEEQLGSAVEVLRRNGVRLPDCGMENMLWDRESRRLTLLGF